MANTAAMTLDDWNAVSSAEREALARKLLRQLPVGFAWCGLHRWGGPELALFEYNEQARFVLLPGGQVTIGFEGPWQPTPEETASWSATATEYGFDHPIESHIMAVTLRSRSVTLAPVLMEVAATEVGWVPISPQAPEVAALKQHLGGGHREATQQKGEVSVRLRRLDSGALEAHRSEPTTHGQIVARWSAEGFRLPDSDEWEFACGGGSRTLFRWGDHAPCDRYPTDASPQEAAWRRRWALSGGRLEYPREGFPATFDLHRRPNRFGLYIADDPYWMEMVAEPGRVRGGDGGTMVCGGAGFFIAWLTLATAYFEPNVCQQPPDQPIAIGYTRARRVLPL